MEDTNDVVKSGVLCYLINIKTLHRKLIMDLSKDRSFFYGKKGKNEGEYYETN